MKVCTVCKIEKDDSEFKEYRDHRREGKTYRFGKCDVCRKESLRNHHYIKKYGITLEEYNSMFEAQSGACEVCDTHQLEQSSYMAVDHNHDTGEVRALLCLTCNTALGGVKEDISILEKLIEYLRKHNEG